MTPPDWIALAVFAVCWLAYEPMLHGLARDAAITRDMKVVRLAWMQAMTGREQKLLDSQLLGHAINSTSFFASANLILIAAVAGALFGGAMELPGVSELGIRASAEALHLKLALVTVCLARGLLEFIWSIRQLNYVLAMVGAAPDEKHPRAEAFAAVAAAVLNPAMTAFSRGVRGYYFALAAAAWLYGPIALGVASVGATALLVWRQSRSPASRGIAAARAFVEAEAAAKPVRRRKNSPKDE